MREVDFGFLFCRAMRFYSMGYQELMELPITVFWTLSNHIERISAQEDLRQFRAMSNSHGGEGTKDYVEGLADTIGKVMVVDPILTAKRDEDGFSELRNMAAQLIG